MYFRQMWMLWVLEVAGWYMRQCAAAWCGFWFSAWCSSEDKRNLQSGNEELPTGDKPKFGSSSFSSQAVATTRCGSVRYGGGGGVHRVWTAVFCHHGH